MEHVKKMVLIPQELLSTIQAKQAEQLAPVDKAIVEINKDMDGLLEEEDLSEHDKAKLYNDKLRRYKVYANKKDVPVTVKVVNENDTVKINDASNTGLADNMTTKIIGSVPKSYNKRVVRLLEKLKKSNMKWNDQGELLIDNEAVPGTDIVDLVNDTVRKRKGFMPHAWETFARGLARVNISREVVGNVDRWDYIQKHRMYQDAPEVAPSTSGNPNRKAHSSKVGKKKRTGVISTPLTKIRWKPY